MARQPRAACDLLLARRCELRARPVLAEASAPGPLDHRSGAAKGAGLEVPGGAKDPAGRCAILRLAGTHDVSGESVGIRAPRAFHSAGRNVRRLTAELTGRRAGGPPGRQAGRTARRAHRGRRAGAGAGFLGDRNPRDAGPTGARTERRAAATAAATSTPAAHGSSPDGARTAAPAGEVGKSRFAPSDEVREQVIADAARLVQWGRKWYELAELISSMADRPHLTDVRRILKDNKSIIDARAGRT